MSKKKSEWAMLRAEIRKHLRRSPLISDGAFRVWDELATGWSWNEPVCFPTCLSVSKAMGKHRNTVSKYITELEKLGLVVRTRKKRGYEFRLIEVLPERFIDDHANNKGLMEDGRRRYKSNKSEPETPDDVHKGLCISEQESVLLDAQALGHSCAQDVVHVDLSHAQGLVHGRAQDVVHVDEDVQSEEVQPEEKSRKKKKKRNPSVSASETEGVIDKSSSRSALVDEDTDSHEEIGTYTKYSEIAGLIEDPWDEGPRRSSRRRRTADKLMVPGSGRVEIPFPEAQGASVSVDLVRFDSGPTPPPPGSSEDVLGLLRSEISEKWGQNAPRFLSDTLTKKLSGQIRNTILKKRPDVILAMIRLLVWDWEVAREICFPFRKGRQYPDVLALVQYSEELAARIDSGFDYPTATRGAANTYRRLFLDGKDRIADDDPF